MPQPPAPSLQPFLTPSNPILQPPPQTRYRAYAVAPVILITFTSIFLMSYNYYQSYVFIKQAESKRGNAAGGTTVSGVG